MQNISNEEYINVLEKEVDTLLRDYYKPHTEGTGHFNTAASVLRLRIKELREMTHGIVASQDC
jgi:hypothetical protein